MRREPSTDEWLKTRTDEQLLEEMYLVKQEIELLEAEDDPDEKEDLIDLIRYLQQMNVHLDVRRWRRGEIERKAVAIDEEYTKLMKRIPTYRRVQRK